MSPIKNIVVVRFSLIVYKHWIEKAYGENGDREAWFAMRAKLFKETLYKSLQRQTVKPAKVFLLMHTDDQSLYQQYLMPIDEFICPIFCEKIDYRKPYEATLQLNGLHENLAVSRIDSDDALADDYFEQINHSITAAAKRGESFRYVVACRGFRTDYESMQEVFFGCSPFITHFMPAYEWENPYSFNHRTVVEMSHISNDTAKWMQILHGSNIANEFAGARLPAKKFEEKIKSRPMLVGTQLLPATQYWPQEFAAFKKA